MGRVELFHLKAHRNEYPYYVEMTEDHKISTTKPRTNFVNTLLRYIGTILFYDDDFVQVVVFLKFRALYRLYYIVNKKLP